MNNKSLKYEAINSFAWKFAERISYYLVQFFVQIVLARLLAPSDFGTLSIVLVVVNIMNVFVQSGLNTALIQSKSISRTDCSTVFWLSFCISVICYIVVFCISPLIEQYYEMQGLSSILRVISILLFINAFNSVQVALVMRGLKTRMLMRSTLISCLVSGALGIVLAARGCGVWALVIQQLSYQLTSCIVLFVQMRWKPALEFSILRAKELYSFSWKLLASSLLDTVYQGTYNLAIGKAFTSTQLGYYTQGDKIPAALRTIIDNSTKTVLLSVASKVQDDHNRIKSVTRKAMMLSTFAVAPVMTILALLAEPIVTILFGEKWLAAVPFMQLMCVAYAFWPVHTSNLQAINAMGRSDIFLKLEIVKKIIGFTILALTLFLSQNLIIVAAGKVVGSLLSIAVNAYPANRYLGYTYWEQTKDIAPAYVLSLFAAAVCLIPCFFLEQGLLSYILQMALFIASYCFMAFVTRTHAFFYTVDTIKELIIHRHSR